MGLKPKVDNKCIEFMKTWDPMLIDDNIPWTDEDKEVMYNDIKKLLTQTQQETLEEVEKALGGVTEPPTDVEKLKEKRQAFMAGQMNILMRFLTIKKKIEEL